MSINDTHRALAKASLGMMASVYDDAVKGRNLPTNGAELYAMMTKVIFEDENLTTIAEKKPTKITEHPSSTGAVLAKDVKNAVKEFSYKPPNAKRAHRLCLPYLPDQVDYSNVCSGMEVNCGLLTACMTRPKKGESYCTGCLKTKSSHGTIYNREEFTSADSENPTGKKAITYGTYLALRNVPREFVESWVNEKFGDNIIIPDSQWVVDIKAVSEKSNQSRERSPSTSSDEEGELPKKRGRGRPKKVVQDTTASPPSSSAVVTEPLAPATPPSSPALVTELLAPASPPSSPAVVTELLAAATPPPSPAVVTEPLAAVAEQEVSSDTTGSVLSDYTVIRTKDDQELITVPNNEEEEFEFVHRVRVMSTGKFYGIDDEGAVFTIIGKSAPLVLTIDDCDLEDGVSWDEEEKKIIFT